MPDGQPEVCGLDWRVKVLQAGEAGGGGGQVGAGWRGGAGGRRERQEAAQRAAAAAAAGGAGPWPLGLQRRPPGGAAAAAARCAALCGRSPQAPPPWGQGSPVPARLQTAAAGCGARPARSARGGPGRLSTPQRQERAGGSQNPLAFRVRYFHTDRQPAGTMLLAPPAAAPPPSGASGSEPPPSEAAEYSSLSLAHTEAAASAALSRFTLETSRKLSAGAGVGAERRVRAGQGLGGALAGGWCPGQHRKLRQQAARQPAANQASARRDKKGAGRRTRLDVAVDEALGVAPARAKQATPAAVPSGSQIPSHPSGAAAPCMPSPTRCRPGRRTQHPPTTRPPLPASRLPLPGRHSPTPTQLPEAPHR